MTQDKLLTSYPLGDFRHPTRASLSSKEREGEKKQFVKSKIHFGKQKVGMVGLCSQRG
jgi:hypothetical protein